MNVLHVTALELAQRLFAGVQEVPGDDDHPLIVAALQMVAPWPQHDEVPWCSAVPFMSAVGLGLPRPGPDLGLRARSWLLIGRPVEISDAMAGPDLAIFRRGSGFQPGPDIIDAPGHVAFFIAAIDHRILVWGGNQNDRTGYAFFPREGLLGLRRLH